MTVSDSAAAKNTRRDTRKKIPVAHRRKARQLVLQALYQWLMNKTEPNQITRQFREENQEKVDWEYFEDVFIAILKNIKSLDQNLLPFIDRKIEALDPIEKALLYLGVFELTHRLDIPYKVVINESIELAHKFGASDSHKYINGVLDKLLWKLRPVELSSK